MRAGYAKIFWATLMSLMVSSLPHVALAAMNDEMISTSEVVETLSRAQAQAKIESYLDREDLQKELIKVGLSRAEVSQRVAGLSIHELNQLAKQMDEARYGGDVIGILVVVLLVVLIVYLVKRI